MLATILDAATHEPPNREYLDRRGMVCTIRGRLCGEKNARTEGHNAVSITTTTIRRGGSTQNFRPLVDHSLLVFCVARRRASIVISSDCSVSAMWIRKPVST